MVPKYFELIDFLEYLFLSFFVTDDLWEHYTL